MNHYVFCMRHYNDVNNIVPVVYFLLEQKAVRVTILIYSCDYPYREDRMLKLLHERFSDRVRVRWVGEARSYSYRVTQNLRFRVWYARYKALRSWAVEHAVVDAQKGFLLEPFVKKRLFDWGKPAVIVFDQNRTESIAGIAAAFRSLGISRIISLPVSPWINYNVLRQVDFVEWDLDSLAQRHDYSVFYEVGQVDPYYSNQLHTFFSLLGGTSPLKGKTRILGSVRYTQKWINVLKDVIPSYTGHDSFDGSRFNMLILPSHPKNNSCWDEYLRTLRMISNRNRKFNIVLKPHTRYGCSNDYPSDMIVENSVETSALIDWSDIILYWSSSVAIEGFQKNKHMVCLDYINCNTSLYAELSSGYIAKSRDDVALLVDQYPQMGKIPTLRYSDGTLFIREIVGDDGDGESVISRHLDFIDAVSPM